MQTTEDMPPNYVTFYVQVDDIQKCLDQAESLGGKTIVPPTPVPGGMGHIGVVQDPSGNSIGLHKF
jgi:predicted enzyme related to lactoylglutathione lyase